MGLADELKALHDLHAAGAITREEWERLKADLIGAPAAPARFPGPPDLAGSPPPTPVVPGAGGEPPPAPPAGPAPPLPPAAPLPASPVAPPGGAGAGAQSRPYRPEPAVGLLLIGLVFVGLTALGVVPTSCTAKLPVVGRLYATTCHDCNGSGKVSQPCVQCGGRGFLGGVTCKTCGGKGKAELTCQFCAGTGSKPKSAPAGGRP